MSSIINVALSFHTNNNIDTDTLIYEIAQKTQVWTGGKVLKISLDTLPKFDIEESGIKIEMQGYSCSMNIIYEGELLEENIHKITGGIEDSGLTIFLYDNVYEIFDVKLNETFYDNLPLIKRCNSRVKFVVEIESTGEDLSGITPEQLTKLIQQYTKELEFTTAVSVSRLKE